MDEMTDIFTSQNFPHIAAHSLQIQLREFKNQYTGSAFIAYTEEKPHVVLGLMCLGVVSYFPATEGINYRNSGCSNGISSLVFPF